MKKKQKIVMGFSLVILFVFVIIACWALNKNKIEGSAISATVTKIVDVPNVAENGYYGITAKDSSGRFYEIDATGYLNTPVFPESNGEACVDIPKVKIGDEIIFNLPRVSKQKNSFEICYKKNLSGYYFKVE